MPLFFFFIVAAEYMNRSVLEKYKLYHSQFK